MHTGKSGQKKEAALKAGERGARGPNKGSNIGKKNERHKIILVHRSISSSLKNPIALVSIAKAKKKKIILQTNKQK